MTDYPLCVTKKVTLKLMRPDGTREVEAVVFGDLAVARRPSTPDYTVYHLPSGVGLASANCVFRYEHTAVACMMDLARLKNRWIFDDIGEMRNLAADARKIGIRHGGSMPDSDSIVGLTTLTQNNNGYGEDNE